MGSSNSTNRTKKIEKWTIFTPNITPPISHFSTSKYLKPSNTPEQIKIVENIDETAHNIIYKNIFDPECELVKYLNDPTKLSKTQPQSMKLFEFSNKFKSVPKNSNILIFEHCFGDAAAVYNIRENKFSPPEYNLHWAIFNHIDVKSMHRLKPEKIELYPHEKSLILVRQLKQMPLPNP